MAVMTGSKQRADAAPADAHAFSDSTNRFCIDQLLRQHGFRIFARAKDNVPIWSKEGDYFTQEGAEQELPIEQLRLARIRQTNYVHGGIDG